MEGSPMSRADLRALKIKLCKTCVILSAKVVGRLGTDHVLLY